MLVEINPEIVKRFQGEFIAHVVERKTVNYLEEGEWHHASPHETSIWSRDSIEAVIHDDSSVLYRRAIAEGKEVQQVKDNRWVKVHPSQLDALVDTPKRVVPVQRFQEWDWVYRCLGPESTRGNNPVKIEKCVYNADTDSWRYILAETAATREVAVSDEMLEPWKPSPGETLAFCDDDGSPIIIDDFVGMREKNYVCANELAYKHVSPIVFNLDMLYPASKANGHK